MTRILIDVSETNYVKILTGIQRVVIEISTSLIHLCEGKSEFEVVLINRRNKRDNSFEEVFFEDLLAPARGFRKLFTYYARRFYTSLRNSNYIVRLILEYAIQNVRYVAHILTSAINIFHPKNTSDSKSCIQDGDVLLILDAFWNNTNLSNQMKSCAHIDYRTVLLVHDIFPLSNPMWFERNSIKLFARNFPQVLTIADTVICVSEYTKRKLISQFHINDEKVAVFNLGGGNFLKTQNFVLNPEDSHNGLSDFGILMIGTIEPRKNYNLALDWFMKYSTKENLTIVGRLGWGSEETLRKIKAIARDTNLKQRFRWELALSDDELAIELKKANIGLSVSFQEGFGLTVLEFLKMNKTVVASDCKAHLEFPKKNIVFFKNNDLEQLNLAIQSAKGKVFAEEDLSKYSWDLAAARVLKLIQSEVSGA